MSRILIIGPYAPHGQVGAIRILSLSRYLTKRGYRVTVLCLSRRSLEEIAPEELCADTPKEVEVSTYDVCQNGSSILVRNIKQITQFKQVLDRLLSQRSFEAAIISGGPFYTFPAARLLRKRHIPYIVDYRDLHVSCREKRRHGLNLPAVKYWLTFPFRVWCEWSCTRNASAATVVYPDMRENLCSFFHIDRKKVYVCYNGFDEEELGDIEELHNPVSQIESNDLGCFTIGYFGKLMYYDQGFTKSFFGAVSTLREAGLDIRVMHIGPSSKAIETMLDTNEYDLRSWYRCTGLMGYRMGMERLSLCDAFYLEYVSPEGPGTKIFDYICINKPVIAMLKKGISMEDFLGRFEGAALCYSEQDIMDALLRVIKGNGRILLDDADRMRYSRKAQNEKFEQVLNETMNKSGRQHLARQS